MKKALFCAAAVLCLLLTSCQGDVNTGLKGKTFVYDNNEYGKFHIRRVLKFEENGNVYDESQLGTSTTFDTQGCSLYYKMIGTQFTIYHGVKGWKKEIRHTVYCTGEYFGSYIIVDDYKLDKQ